MISAISGFDSLVSRIAFCLQCHELEASEKRIDQVWYALQWEILTKSHGLPVTEKEISSVIQDLYNFKRYKNTKLTKKLFSDKIIKETKDWVYIRDYHGKDRV